MNMSVPGLSNYELNELIHQGDRTLVYRGRKINNGQPAVIKLMQQEYPTFNELIQFRNQYVIVSSLDVEGIVKPYALERYQNRYALIMDDFGGISLKEYYQNSSPSIPEFLSLGIQLSQILHQLHQNRVIHKDIKPANILIHPETQKVKLIDFSISSLLPKETQSLQTPNVLEGTLAYISPEQTGRMNRGIDYRSDFYGLGVTFYELLSGKLPFETNDALELIHCHIAKMPAALGKKGEDIPEMLSDIVLKLMAKNAEDRYQSALGLKYDLERCLQEWEATGKITTFEIGRRDISERFLISEKLYGRETEVQTLLDAFSRVSQGNSELLLVAGYSGVGKTAVVNEAHKPITEKRGYFIKGKFDQFQRNIPFFAFVVAFRDLIKQLLAESDAQLENWKNKIIEAVGENGQVIIEVIPELETIIGKQPSVPQLEGNAAQNRFNLLFPKFVGAFLSLEHPLTIFIDDLQWADSASLSLLKLLTSSSKAGYLLILGAYRDNEVFPAHPLMVTLEEIQQNNRPFQTLTLAPLDELNINRWVADTLWCSVELAAPLSELVYQKTGGNPFFTAQFLKGLHEDNWIVFDSEARYWQCDLARVRQLALTDDVVEFMVGRLRKLPVTCQSVLKLAACIGNRFDLETLAIVSEANIDEVAAALWPGLEEGFVIPESDTYKFFQGNKTQERGGKEVAIAYHFLHDRVQQAAYSLINEESKQITHLKIGKLFLNNTPQETQESKIFDIVNQLNLGSQLIKQSSEIYQLGKLNFLAAKKAKHSTAYSSAFEYSELARGWLSETFWQSDYELCLSLYELSAETAYLTGDFTTAEAICHILEARALHVWDRVKACETTVQILMSKNELLQAIRVGLNFLASLDVDLPPEPQDVDIDRALAEIAAKLSGRKIESLIDLPIARDKKQSASMRILSVLLNAAYLGMPNLLPIIVAKQVDLSVTYGNIDISPSAYANYGLILCGIVGDIDSGTQFGRLALDLLNKFESTEFYAKTIEIVCLAVKHWKEHISSTLDLLLSSYKMGLESGDFESASFAAYDYCAHSLIVGQNLIDLERKMVDYSEAIGNLNQRMMFNLNELHRQVVLNLIETTDRPSCLKGEAYDEEKMLPIHQQNNDFSSLALFYIDKLFICYAFGLYREATEIASQGESYLEGIPGQVFVPIFYLYDALSWLAIYSTLEKEAQKTALKRILSHETKIAKWADGAATNYAHKLCLLQAEKHRVLGEKSEAMESYDRAIEGAKENQFLHEEALANELAAKFYLDWGKEKVAKSYMEEAYYCYARWGAKAKTDQLEAKYPQFLTFQQAQSKLHSKTSSNPSLGTVASTASSIDFAAAIKASRAISEQIELDSLLRALIQIVLENAGADKATLILNNSDTLVVVARCESDRCELLNVPLDESNNLPRGIVNTVRRTRKTILSDKLEGDQTSIADPYFLQNRPKSFCCIPIVERDRLLGILYLENNLTAEAFSSDRLEVLNLLTAQAAISIENARLYRHLEDYSHDLEAQVESRTKELQEKNQDLQQAFKQLQQTQAQLIQTEKMSALGQMVAGVAHEINNPVNFIAGNIAPAKEYACDLLDLLALYEEKAPSEVIEEKAEEIDLEYLREDLTKILDSMQGGSDRIAKIVLGLRNFSRLGESEIKRVDLHDGLENTLLILQHRFLGSEDRPEIAIFKNYGELPPIDCYPSQLNQVFLQIIENAIDALRESQTSERLEIRIATEMPDAQTLRIRIADSGPGMSESDRQKAFDPFFTTKPVGKGTGLGLSISYQIVTEQHGGRLQCVSELGKGTEFIIDIPLLRLNN